MNRQLVLWGPPIVSSSPGDLSFPEDVAAWVSKCSSVGITKIIGGDQTRVLTEAANAVGIEVHPYVNYNSFPRHGSSKVGYGWSLDFLRPVVGSSEARAVMDRHRPIWDSPTVTTTMTDFARQHPQFRSLTRDRSYALRPGEDLYLSPAFPEVRAHQTKVFLDALESGGGDGLQVEFVLGNEDENGVVPYGYEDRVVSEFQDKHGSSPFNLPNNDADWMQFRSDYITRVLIETRDKVKQRFPDISFSTTIIAGEQEEYIKVLQDWPAWVDLGIVDEFYLWFRTDSNLKKVAHQTKYAADLIKGRCPLIVELSCYHPGSFQESDLMVEGARVALANGANAVGIYRSHAVDQLDFWPVLEEIAKL